MYYIDYAIKEIEELQEVLKIEKKKLVVKKLTNRLKGERDGRKI